MRAGRHRDRVSFEAKQSTPDGAGGSTVDWVEQFTRWGEVIEDKGRERVEGGRLASPFAATLSIRSSTAARQITTAWRCVINDEAWNIRSIGNPDRRNRRLELVIERGVAT
jgi:SPP1 family predicted phage head-tail adaptor